MTGTTLLESWKQRANNLKHEVCALYLACRDPRVAWPVRLLALAVVGYDSENALTVCGRG